jgi:hypothetical protein
MDMDLQFPADAEEARVHSRRNISHTERWVSVAAGTLMAAYGVSRRRGNGWLLATMGALLVRRGVTGHCHTYDFIGVNRAGTGEDTRRVRNLEVLPRFIWTSAKISARSNSSLRPAKAPRLGESSDYN